MTSRSRKLSGKAILAALSTFFARPSLLFPARLLVAITSTKARNTRIVEPMTKRSPRVKYRDVDRAAVFGGG